MKNQNSHRRLMRRRFSLIEILVVIVIIGLVLGLAIPNINRRLQWAKWDVAKNQCKILSNAIDTYYLDTGDYPRTLDALVRNPGSGGKWRGPYMKDGNLPKDPWGTEYHFDTDGRTFKIYSYGADKTPGGTDYNSDVSNVDEED
jgi:general secretion pathway protein G